MPLPGFDNLIGGGIQNPQTFYNNTSAATLPGMGQLDGFGVFGPDFGQNFGGGSTNNSFFGANQSTMQNITQGLGAFTSLANLYGMFKNLKLQNKAFKFGQEGTKRNFNANATGFNNQVDQYQGAREASALARGRAPPTNAPQKVGLWG